MNELPILTKNQAIFIKSLSESNTRKKYNRILVEGVKCCYEVINSKCAIDYFVINTINKEIDIILEKANKKNIKIFQTKASIFKTLCDAKSPQNIIAIAEPQASNIIDNCSFVALDNVSDPGNVGTIIRTADWFGIKQIILLGNCADKYNPKVIRASMGSIFRVNLINNENNIGVFKEHFNEIPIYAANINGSTSINEIEKSNKFGLIVGNESRGISAYLNGIITKNFYISGTGNAESLNVAIATGITLFYFTNKG